MRLLKMILAVLFVNQLPAQVTLTLRTDTSIRAPLNGRLYIYTQSDTSKAVPNQPDPSQPMFAFNLSGWQGERVVELNSKADHMPVHFSALQPGYYKVAGIIDADPGERGSFNPGNVYARKEVILYINEKGEGRAEILFGSVVQPQKFRENDSVKQVILPSKLLSDFRKKPVFLQSAIRLPASYSKELSRLYPLVFVIPGWGGTHYDLQGSGPVKRYGMNEGKEKIYVYLNPENQSPFGLHAFVDSRVNGPWGKALVEELIPYLQQQYRINPDPSQHFVIGQSSGGYGSLWLQVYYPDVFGGCWSVSPDPVDFSAFTSVDLYEKEANLFTDKTGALRPFYLVNGKPLSTLKELSDMETFTGDGEQLQAFEAEFGVPDASGRPRKLFNRLTGIIDTAVVKTWAPYDMGSYIQQNWPKLGKKLSGKIHVYAGGADNFFLNKAVESFSVKAKAVRAALVAEIIPGADHWSIWSPEFTRRVQKEIDERIK
eukprot:Opistho-2@7594